MSLFQEGLKRVTRIDSFISEGVTQPIKCILEDGSAVVVKYPYNNCGTNILVREWIGTWIGSIINVPIPEFGLCLLPENVIEIAMAMEGECCPLDKRNSGIAFYTRMYDATTPCQMNWLRSINTYDYAIIVIYDYILNNIDRHDGNILRVIDKSNSILCIDNSHILTDANDLYRNIPKSNMFDEEELYKFFSANKKLFNILLKDITPIDFMNLGLDVKSRISDEVLDTIAKKIPKEWLTGVDYSNIEGIIEFIKSRVDVLDKVCLEMKEGL